MHKVKISLLEEFRSVRSESGTANVADLKAMIKGTYKPLPVMTIAGTVHNFLQTGAINDIAFTLMPKEIEKLTEISETIGNWAWGNPIRYAITPDILITGSLPLMKGLHGAEIKVGLEEIQGTYLYSDESQAQGVNIYDDSISWKAYCYALKLPVFKLYYITFGDFRPYTFELFTFQYFRYPEIESELIKDCEQFVKWCISNNLEQYILA